MALSAKVVTFLLNTGTGNQAITGVGFQPKIVILWCNGTNTGIASGNAFGSLGAATSSSSRWANGWWSNDASDPSNTARSARTNQILDVPNPNGASSDYQADFVSMDSDGFTINVGAGGVALQCAALCLGGDDLDAAVGSFQTGTSTGSQTAVSGLAFQPKAVISSWGLVAAGVGVNIRADIGFATSSTDRWAMGAWENDNVGTTITAHAYFTDRYIGGVTNSAGADTEIDFGAFTSDGWTHDIVAVPADLFICYIALGGSAQFKAGSDTQATSATTKATTGVGFEPVALLTSMGLRTTSGGDADGDLFVHFGMLDGTTEAGGHLFSDDNTAAGETSRGINTSYSLFAVTDDATPTVAARASLDSFDSDGFTFNWNTADATARLFGFLAIGAAPAAGGAVGVGLLNSLKLNRPRLVA